MGALAALGVAADLRDLIPSVVAFEQFQREFKVGDGQSGLMSTRGLVHLTTQALTTRFRKSITFKQLHNVTGCRLVICATGTHSGSVEHMDHVTAPHVRVVDAVAASMAVPFLFAPHRIGNAYYMDGAIRHTVPAHVCDAVDSIVCYFAPKPNVCIRPPAMMSACLAALGEYVPDDRAINIPINCDDSSFELASVLLSSSDVPQMIVRLVRLGYMQTANALDHEANLFAQR